MTGDAYWETITCTCPKGHDMTLTRVDASRHANFRFVWVCIRCGTEHTDIRNIIGVINDCAELDLMKHINDREFDVEAA